VKGRKQNRKKDDDQKDERSRWLFRSPTGGWGRSSLDNAFYSLHTISELCSFGKSSVELVETVQDKLALLRKIPHGKVIAALPCFLGLLHLSHKSAYPWYTSIAQRGHSTHSNMSSTWKLNSPHTLLVLDWDGTVAAHDTLSLIAPSPEALKPYTEAYMADAKVLSDKLGERNTLDNMFQWLDAMEGAPTYLEHMVVHSTNILGL
jgi:hypothetical protein